MADGRPAETRRSSGKRRRRSSDHASLLESDSSDGSRSASQFADPPHTCTELSADLPAGQPPVPTAAPLLTGVALALTVDQPVPVTTEKTTGPPSDPTQSGIAVTSLVAAAEAMDTAVAATVAAPMVDNANRYEEDIADMALHIRLATWALAALAAASPVEVTSVSMQSQQQLRQLQQQTELFQTAAELAANSAKMLRLHLNNMLFLQRQLNPQEM